MLIKHLIGVLASSCIFGICVSIFPLRPLASDARLISYFHKHRADFDKIEMMATDDLDVSAVSHDFVMLSGPHSGRWQDDDDARFSTARWDQYRQLFNDLSGVSIYSVSKSGGVVEICCGSIAVDDDTDRYERVVSSKSFVFSQNVLLPEVESLDSFGFETSATYYRRIDGNWYLKYDSGETKPE